MYSKNFICIVLVTICIYNYHLHSIFPDLYCTVFNCILYLFSFVVYHFLFAFYKLNFYCIIFHVFGIYFSCIVQFFIYIVNWFFVLYDCFICNVFKDCLSWLVTKDFIGYDYPLSNWVMLWCLVYGLSYMSG